MCATLHAHFLPGSDLVLWQALIKSNMHCGRAVRLMKDPFYSLPPAPESEMNNPRSVLNPFHIYYPPLLTCNHSTQFVMEVAGLFDGEDVL